MGRRVRGAVRRYYALFQLLILAALNGAVTGLLAQMMLPEFEWKSSVVWTAVVSSSLRAALNILIASPYGNGDGGGRRRWPRPQPRPPKGKGGK